MGRKKSIATQLSGKSLAQARQQLRDIEKQMIDESYRQAGQLILSVFTEDPTSPVFTNNLLLTQTLDELQQVAGRRRSVGKTRQEPAQLSEPVVSDNDNEVFTESSQIVNPRPGYKPVHFVSDVPDGDL